MRSSTIRIFFAQVDGVGATMEIGFLVPSADRSAAPTSSNTLGQSGQPQQPAQRGAFSALLKDVAQNLSKEQLPPFSDAEDSTEPASLIRADNYVTDAMLSHLAGALVVDVRDLHDAVSPVDDTHESVEDSTGGTVQSTEGIPLLSQDLSVAAAHDDGSLGREPVPTDPPKPSAMDASIDSLLQSDLDPAKLSDASEKQAGSQPLEAPPIRNGRGTPSDPSPALLKQSSDSSVLPGTPPPGSLASGQTPVPVLEGQGEQSPLSAVSANEVLQSLDRPSVEVQVSAKVHAQVIDEPALPGRPLSASVIGDSGGTGHDPLEADAQGAEEGALFNFGENGAPESVTRDNQPSFFNSQLMSAQQAQSSTVGESSSGVTPAADQLKTVQALLREDHSGSITSASGKAQSVHVELPSHDSGPLSVRISMTDQTVHTQFTTDRNDLGALLFTRQDQLQHNLAKSGLELGQFQVNVDQQGRQEAFPDRQSRRNGGAPDQQPASQDQNQQSQDRERPHHRSSRALSLFA